MTVSGRWAVGGCGVAATLVSRFQKNDNKSLVIIYENRVRQQFSYACTRIRARAERAHAILVTSTGLWLPTSWIQSWRRFIVRCISRFRGLYRLLGGGASLSMLHEAPVPKERNTGSEEHAQPLSLVALPIPKI